MGGWGSVGEVGKEGDGKTTKLRASSQRQGESSSVVLSLNEAVAVVKSHFWLTTFAQNTDMERICSLIASNGYTMSPWLAQM